MVQKKVTSDSNEPSDTIKQGGKEGQGTTGTPGKKPAKSPKTQQQNLALITRQEEGQILELGKGQEVK